MKTKTDPNTKSLEGKPPYRVPTMAEIAAIPLNGYKAISTFSGCGGSCLGYRMAGFKILWASEFIPAAQEVYRLNHPDCILDTRDIRKVTPEEILDAIGLEVGELDLMDGSPPCASFSTAGKREKSWGQVKNYSDTKQRTDDLFFEYTRLLKGLQPKVFVAENVSGLVKGTAKGYFKIIMQELKACGYNVKAKLLDAQWLGVPQMRQRVIFMGVRNDLGLEPVYPKPLPYRYSVREAIPWIISQRHGKGFGEEEWIGADEAPSQTVGTGPASGNNINNGAFKVEVARVVDDTGGQYSAGDVTDKVAPTVDTNPRFFVETRAYRDKRGAFGNDGDITDQPAPTVLSDSIGTHWVVEPTISTFKETRSVDDPAPTVLTPVREHTNNELMIVEPETDISRYAIGREWDKLEPGGQSEKYFQLTRAPLGPSSGAITQRGGDNTVASVTHPTEKRKFTIAELKRICAFPDDFQLTGSYAQQWERLGRAVPPVMMQAVALVVRDEILAKLK